MKNYIIFVTQRDFESRSVQKRGQQQQKILVRTTSLYWYEVMDHPSGNKHVS